MDVLITSLPEKLPLEIRQLEDAGQPLPADVRFFEEKLTAASLLKPVILGVMLEILGVLLILPFLYLFPFRAPLTVYSPQFGYGAAFGATGVVFLFGGYLLLRSLRPRYRLMQQQHQGVDTRYGIFLTGDLLVSHSWFDTTIIPRSFFKGLQGNAVAYELNGSLKSFDLPGAFVGAEMPRVQQAIRDWADSRRET